MMTNRLYNKFNDELLIVTEMIATANNDDIRKLYGIFLVELPSIEDFVHERYLLDQIELMMKYCLKYELYEICKLLQDITKKINKK